MLSNHCTLTSTKEGFAATGVVSLKLDKHHPYTDTVKVVRLFGPFAPSTEKKCHRLNTKTDPEVEGVGHYDRATLDVTFRPAEPLSYLREYIVYVDGNAFKSVDMKGNSLSTDTSYTFRTEAPPPPITVMVKVEMPHLGSVVVIANVSNAKLVYPLPTLAELQKVLLENAGADFVAADVEVAKVECVSTLGLGEVSVPLTVDADVLEIQAGDTVVVSIAPNARLAPSPAGLRVFSREELEAATKGFCAAELINDDGGFGPVYHGVLGATHHIAVKVMRESTVHNAKQLEQEIATLQQCRHPNLVPLIGICTTAPACIVYEHKSGGSLLDALNRSEPKLTWRRRFCILLEVTSGLEYLHTAVDPPIVHRDIKSANVLLSATLSASVGDFGLARICPEMNDAIEVGGGGQRSAGGNDVVIKLTRGAVDVGAAPSGGGGGAAAKPVSGKRKRDGDSIGIVRPGKRKASATTKVFGTPGYIDPEYAKTGKVTLASDIYSLGIVALELLTSRKAYDEAQEPDPVLIDAFEEALEESESDLLGLFDTDVANWPHVPAFELVEVIKKCIHSKARKRIPVAAFAQEVIAICDKWKATPSGGEGAAAAECIICFDAPPPRKPFDHVATCALAKSMPTN